MTAMRKTALAAITILVAMATSASFAESYRALFEWAARHGLHGVWAAAWPLQVDVFVAVGELALVVALADSWPTRSRTAAWTVALAGLGVSIAGNVGHVASHDWASRATAAVPPLAAAAALAVGLGVLKRVVAARVATTPSRPSPGTVQHARRARTGSAPARRTRPEPVTRTDAEAEFMPELASGAVPSIRQIRTRLHVGSDRARQVQAHLRPLASTAQPVSGAGR
jgi:Protein of unknown function (DUF2637)